MADLRTTYMGVPLANPIVVGASSLSRKVDTIRQLEDAGAGGLVIKSLFEEQIQAEAEAFHERLTQYDNSFVEAVSMFPNIEHGGPKQHLYWIEQTRRQVRMPLFASLNCINRETWVSYARQLAETGVDGLELNFYSPPLDPTVTAADIEAREIETLAEVREAVRIPIAVKLHPYYTSLMNVAARFQEVGAQGLVLFNRLFQPDIDLDREQKIAQVQLTHPGDSLVPLRWTALLSQRLEVDLIASTGVDSGADVARMILAGAAAVQVVSTLYRHGPKHIGTMQNELQAWMEGRGYATLGDFRAKLARPKLSDAWSFERGQYIKALIGFD